MPAEPYIGPERRKGQDRRVEISTGASYRRTGIERRQNALAGVIIGLSAEQMELLAELYRKRERYPDAFAALRKETAPTMPRKGGNNA